MPAPDPEAVVLLTQHCDFSLAISAADEHPNERRAYLDGSAAGADARMKAAARTAVGGVEAETGAGGGRARLLDAALYVRRVVGAVAG